MQLPTKRTGIEAMLSSSTPEPWKVEFYSGGGVTAIMLHDPADMGTKEKVHTLLTKLAADPNNGIESILDEKQIAERGGFPGASYLIVNEAGILSGSCDFRSAGYRRVYVERQPRLPGLSFRKCARRSSFSVREWHTTATSA